MKLHELTAPNSTKQITKVFESYFGNRLRFDSMSHNQARTMLRRVCGLIKEHRSQPAFHVSEQTPSYLKLIMIEQGLTSKLHEELPVNPADKAQSDIAAKAEIAKVTDPKLKAAMTKSQAGQPLTPDEQKLVTGAAMMKQEGRRTVREASELQQAQVVLASQDMIDQIQKMLESVSEMQFKDLPALVDQAKNEVGPGESAQFQTAATASLTALLAALQQGKVAMEQAQGALTGQEQAMPVDDLSAPAVDSEMSADADSLPDADFDADLDDTEVGADRLGRDRR